MMLFLFDKKNNICVHPEALKLTDKLKKVDKQQAAFIILAYDYYSPYNQFEEPVRLQKVCRRIFLSDDKANYETPEVLEAIGEYKGLQFDIERETIRTYRSKVVAMQQLMERETSDKRIKDLINTIRLLQQEISALEGELVHREEERAIVGGGALSFLEQWKENQKVYRKEQERIKAQKAQDTANAEERKKQIIDLDLDE